jgi:hypothetical protein
VVEFTCDPVNDRVGTDHWLVYRNTGAGFAAAGTNFAMPPGYGYAAFSTLASSSPYCTNVIDPAYALLDVDGDARPDLVVLFTCDPVNDRVGTDHWLVYKNSGAGFAAQSSRFALPPGYGYAAFSTVSSSSPYCNNVVDPAYALLDADGDDRPDLVVLFTCTPQTDGVGTTQWLIYRNTGTGFVAQPGCMALPSGYGYAAFSTLSSSSPYCNNTSDPAYFVLDLDGDRRLDIDVDFTCDPQNDQVGTARWLLYRGAGTP